MTQGIGVLGLVGSPREGGNTDTLVREVLRGAEEAGARTQRLFVGRHKIAPCTSCGGCIKTGRCVTRDGMDDLLPLMEANQVWVLGTPVYWWGATAQMKLFVDRWFAPWLHPKTREMFRNRVAVVVTPFGDTNPATARHTTGMFTDVFAFLGVPLVATILAPGVGGSGLDAPADVLKHPEILREARDAGHAAVAAAGKKS